MLCYCTFVHKLNYEHSGTITCSKIKIEQPMLQILSVSPKSFDVDLFDLEKGNMM